MKKQNPVTPPPHAHAFKSLILNSLFILCIMPSNAQNLSLQLTASDYNGYNISCFGVRDGEIDLTITGGYPPYSIIWSNAATVEDLSDLASGYYRVEVTDDSSNFASVEITLTEPERIRIEFTTSEYLVNGKPFHISLFGACNGNIAMQVSGGVLPYSYSWYGSAQTTAVISQLCAGEYKGIVTDYNNCQDGLTQLMTEPPRDDWTMTGNAGSNPVTDFIGTSDEQDLVVKTNAEERLRIGADGFFKINSFSGNGNKLLFADSNGFFQIQPISFLEVAKPGLTCNDPFALNAWRHKTSNPSAIYTCTDRVGIGNDEPHEFLEIGTRFTFHSGGSKVISYNSYWDGVRKRISTDAVSALHFHLNGDVEFTACPAGGNPDDDIDALMQSVMKIMNDGKIGIGIEPQAGYKLTVDGKVGVREVYVRATGAWPDYVFDSDYKMMTLKEAGRFMKKHKHLPGMKPAAEIETEGQPLGEIQKLQQEHLEKLYLYILQLEQRIEELEERK
ncbi:MAG: SprB repeat-containing protein [Bacteroidia bacterium]|nr:SprB repeat-containing protein [Bacteroidia bacterium]